MADCIESFAKDVTVSYRLCTLGCGSRCFHTSGSNRFWRRDDVCLVFDDDDERAERVPLEDLLRRE